LEGQLESRGKRGEQLSLSARRGQQPAFKGRVEELRLPGSAQVQKKNNLSDWGEGQYALSLGGQKSERQLNDWGNARTMENVSLTKAIGKHRLMGYE